MPALPCVNRLRSFPPLQLYESFSLRLSRGGKGGKKTRVAFVDGLIIARLLRGENGARGTTVAPSSRYLYITSLHKDRPAPAAAGRNVVNKRLHRWLVTRERERETLLSFFFFFSIIDETIEIILIIGSKNHSPPRTRKTLVLKFFNEGRIFDLNMDIY